MYCEQTSLAPQLSKPVSQAPSSELEKLLLKPTRQTKIPFSHMKRLMNDDGFAGSNASIRGGGGEGKRECDKIRRVRMQ